MTDVAPRSGDDRPYATVVVPAYNAERTIGPCLESLLEQTCDRSRYEVVVVDDGSTDATADVARRYAVRVISQKNQGPAAARNAGVVHGRGEVVVFTDSDCIAERDWLEQMLAPFADPGIGAVKGAYKTRSPAWISRFAQLEFEERYVKLRQQPYIDFIATYAAAFRRSLFLDMGGFDAAYPVANNEDVEFSYRLAQRGVKMVFRPNAIVYHRHAATLRHYLRTKFWRGYWRMVVYRSFPEKMLRDTYTPQRLKLQIAAAAVMLAALTVIVFQPATGLTVFLVSAGAFLATALSFLQIAFAHDRAVGWMSVPLLVCRAVAIGAGITYFLVIGTRKLRPRESASHSPRPAAASSS